MKEMVKGILDTWILFWGSGYYQYLILLAVIAAFAFFQEKERRQGFLLDIRRSCLCCFSFP